MTTFDCGVTRAHETKYPVVSTTVRLCAAFLFACTYGGFKSERQGRALFCRRLKRERTPKFICLYSRCALLLLFSRLDPNRAFIKVREATAVSQNSVRFGESSLAQCRPAPTLRHSQTREFLVFKASALCSQACSHRKLRGLSRVTSKT